MNSEEHEPLHVTEQENTRARGLESLSAFEIVQLMNREDEGVARAVGLVLTDVARAVDDIVERLERTGRLFYLGAGSSGRLGVLDASECPPTFGVPPEMVQAVIAGGFDAVYRATEASEDDAEAGAGDLLKRGFTGADALVGLSASGHTPYTVGALKHARSLGAFTIAVTCAPASPATLAAHVSIAPLVGPEILAGSTRLKAGTAQKMILNMISTATMIRLGYVAGNRMSNLKASNTKLGRRAARILMDEFGLDSEDARRALETAGGRLPVAMVMRRTGCNRDEAVRALENSRGIVRRAVEIIQDSTKQS